MICTPHGSIRSRPPRGPTAACRPGAKTTTAAAVIRWMRRSSSPPAAGPAAAPAAQLLLIAALHSKACSRSWILLLLAPARTMILCSTRAAAAASKQQQLSFACSKLQQLVRNPQLAAEETTSILLRINILQQIRPTAIPPLPASISSSQQQRQLVTGRPQHHQILWWVPAADLQHCISCLCSRIIIMQQLVSLLLLHVAAAGPAAQPWMVRPARPAAVQAT